MNTTGHIDDIDQKLILALQKSGRVKQSELAEETGLSVPAVGERIKKLEEAGVITEYRAVVDYRKLGFDVTSFVAVTIDSSKHFKSFLEKVHKCDEIIECHAITGDGTHMLKLRVHNTAELEKLLSRIQSWQGVANTTTRVVLSSPKETTNITLK